MLRQTRRAALVALVVLGSLALAAAQEPKQAGGEKSITNSIGMKLVLIPAGEFMMGNEEGRIETLNYFTYAKPKGGLGDSEKVDAELPRHKVRITRPFYMGQYTVTLNEFLIFYHDAHYQVEIERDGKPGHGWVSRRQAAVYGFIPSPNFRPWAPGWEIGRDHPVLLVSWNDATAFCDWLSKREKNRYRLPTEAEWEYACRAGTNSRYYFGNDPEELVNYANAADQDFAAQYGSKGPTARYNEDGTSTSYGFGMRFPFLRRRDGYAHTAPVGKFRPNAFGLYDMHGNVDQWCSDWYDAGYYAKSPVDDPKGPATGSDRVYRGGSFGGTPFKLRDAYRGIFSPSGRDCETGFRVVCEP
jgi:formylglycine-generating enzyme required for sulfatase activity